MPLFMIVLIMVKVSFLGRQNGDLASSSEKGIHKSLSLDMFPNDMKDPVRSNLSV